MYKAANTFLTWHPNCNNYNNLLIQWQTLWQTLPHCAVRSNNIFFYGYYDSQTEVDPKQVNACEDMSLSITNFVIPLGRNAIFGDGLGWNGRVTDSNLLTKCPGSILCIPLSTLLQITFILFTCKVFSVPESYFQSFHF